MHIHPAHSRFHCIYDSIVSFEDGLQNMLIKKQEILAVKTLRDTDYELLSNDRGFNLKPALPQSRNGKEEVVINTPLSASLTLYIRLWSLVNFPFTCKNSLKYLRTKIKEQKTTWGILCSTRTHREWASNVRPVKLVLSSHIKQCHISIFKGLQKKH